MLRTFVQYWLPVLGYVTVIVVLSAQPGLRAPISVFGADKLAHIAEYFVLGWLLARAWGATLPDHRFTLPALLSILTGVAIGAGDELFQRTIPGRDSSVLDLLADAIGVLFAQLAFQFSRKD